MLRVRHHVVTTCTHHSLRGPLLNHSHKREMLHTQVLLSQNIDIRLRQLKWTFLRGELFMGDFQQKKSVPTALLRTAVILPYSC